MYSCQHHLIPGGTWSWIEYNAIHASQAPLTRQTMHRTARTRVPMNNSKGAAFYASGNIAGEALRHYCTDLWTGTCVAKAIRPKGQRM